MKLILKALLKILFGTCYFLLYFSLLDVGFCAKHLLKVGKKLISLIVSGICNSVKNKGDEHTKIALRHTVTREQGTSTFLKKRKVISADMKNTDRRRWQKSFVVSGSDE